MREGECVCASLPVCWCLLLCCVSLSCPCEPSTGVCVCVCVCVTSSSPLPNPMSGKGGGGTFSQLRDHLLPPSATAALPDFFFAGGVDAEACGYLRGDAVVGAAYSGQWYDTVSHPTKTPQKSLPQQQQQQRGMHDSGLEVLMVVVAVVNLLSTTFVFQTLSAASLPPYFLLAFRTLFAGLLGYVVCGVLGFWQRQFWHAAALSMCSDHLWKIIMLGLLSSAGALGMWFTANQYIRSTTTSSFMLLVPFFTAVVSQAMGRGVVRNRDVVGFFLGGTVILCLFLPDWTRGDSSLHSSSSGEVIAGILLSLMGGLLFAMATAFLARNCSLHPFAVSCGQNLWGGLLLVPLSFITEWNDPPEHIAQHFGFLRGLSPHIWVFFAFLTILALVLVWLFNSLVYSSDPTAAASTLYFVPLESGILGIALHDEWQEFGI